MEDAGTGARHDAEGSPRPDHRRQRAWAKLAESFAREGARLILAARRRDRLTSLAARLATGYGTASHLLELDVRDHEAVNAGSGGLPDGFGDIDILVNNAGLGRGLDKLHEGDPELGRDAGHQRQGPSMSPERCCRGWWRATAVNHQHRRGGPSRYSGGNVYCATNALFGR